MASGGYDSPTTIDAPLEYVTVDNYEWPKAQVPKRSRLNEQERKRRHNECQKRFLARKRRSFELLHSEIARLELQLQWLNARREAAQLEREHCQLRRQPQSRDQAHSQGAPMLSTALEPQTTEETKVSDDALLEHVVQSLNVDALVAELGFP